jgi:hypothetical protein
MARDDEIIRQIRGLALQILTLTDQIDQPNSPAAGLSAKELARVEKYGEAAYRHLRHIEDHGSMTLGDSLAIRRELFPTNIRSTANMFGTSDSGALLHRTTPYGTPRDDDQEVRLTESGRRIARLWAELHDKPL